MNTTLVNDGQTRWACDTADLVAALDKLGWTKTTVGPGYSARVEPDDIKTEDFGPYVDLCNAVAPYADSGDMEADRRFTFYPEFNAWVWDQA